MKSLYILFFLFFYSPVFSQVNVVLHGYYWDEQIDTYARMTLSLSADSSWISDLKQSYIIQNGVDKKLYPANIISSHWDRFQKKNTVKLAFIVVRKSNVIVFHLPESLGGKQFVIDRKLMYRDTTRTATESLYRSIMKIGTYRFRLYYSLKDAGGIVQPSYGGGLGVYPAIYHSADRNKNIYMGGEFDYMRTFNVTGSDIEKHYSVDRDLYRIYETSSAYHSIKFLGVSVIYTLKLTDALTPVFSLGSGLYTVSFNNFKIYDCRTGLSVNDPSISNIGFKLEAGMNFLKLFYAGYLLNFYSMAGSDIDFLNKKYFYHTFMIGFMGL